MVWSFCPICGVRPPSGTEQHRCDPRRLRAIDAAHEHADDEGRKQRGEYEISEGRRIAEGMELLDLDGDDHGDDERR